MSGVVDNALPSVSPPKTRAAPVKKRVDANCSVCGALVDMRDLTQVMAHLHGVEPLDLTGKPDP